jgi:hypothetical protein
LDSSKSDWKLKPLEGFIPSFNLGYSEKIFAWKSLLRF